MKQLACLIVTLFFFSIVKAQEYQIDWQNSIGGFSNDNLTCMKVAPDGGYILGGLSLSNISGDKTENSLGLQDYWIVKTNTQGVVEWDNTIGGNDLDQLIDIAVTTDGGYILAGSSLSNISGDKTENSKGGIDYWIVKLNAAGAIEWQNTIGGSEVDFLRTVSETPDGGFFLGGYSRSNISGDKTENSKGALDYWVVKVDDLGDVEWDKTIGGDGNEFLTSAVVTSDGGYLLSGVSYSNASGDKSENVMGAGDFWLVKLDATGSILWENTIGGNNIDAPSALIEATGGGYIVGGESNSNASGDKIENSLGETDFWVFKIDSLGDLIWQNTIGGSEEDAIKSMYATADGGYILGGFSNSNSSGDKTENARGSYDFWVVGNKLKMKFLMKNRTKNWIIKLFKLTDENSAEMFEMESKILLCIKQIEKISELKAKSFDINYQSTYKTKSGFEKALKSNKELVYCFVDFDSEKTGTYFTISNQMLNLKKKPEKSTIDFCLQISTEYCNEKSILEFNRILIDELGFDYGYTTKLDSDFDSGTERKMKKGLFSTSVKILEKDHIWTSNKIEILNGIIKNLYPINYINESHLADSEQKKIISEFGILSKKNNRIYEWNLTDVNIEYLKKTKRTELKLVE